jgi:acid phosphatase class B
MYTRIGLVLAGVLVIVMMNVDITYLLSRILFWNNKSSTTSEKDFLTMINLWYKLKESCVKNNFDTASDKLDEVFPLLNNRSTNE